MVSSNCPLVVNDIIVTRGGPFPWTTIRRGVVPESPNWLRGELKTRGREISHEDESREGMILNLEGRDEKPEGNAIKK
jgi:hypothetical protein